MMKKLLAVAVLVLACAQAQAKDPGEQEKATGTNRGLLGLHIPDMHACQKVSVMLGVGLWCFRNPDDSVSFEEFWLWVRDSVRLKVEQEVEDGQFAIWAADCHPAIGQPGWECQ